MGLISRFRSILHYNRFSKCLVENKLEEAVRIYSELKIEGSFLPLAHTKYASTLYSLRRFGEAAKEFEASIKLEYSLNGLRDEQDSEYIVAYCELYQEVSSLREKGDDPTRLLSCLSQLDRMPVKPSLKKFDLPLPVDGGKI